VKVLAYVDVGVGDRSLSRSSFRAWALATPPASINEPVAGPEIMAGVGWCRLMLIVKLIG